MTRYTKLESLLKSDNINASIIKLDNFISKLCKNGDEIEKLTDPQKFFYLNQNLEREVNNGGFDQYFCNSGSDNAFETITSLKAIGADKTADILQRAIDLVLQIIEQFQEQEVPTEIWNEIDQDFLSYNEDLNALNIEYVKNNKSLF